MSTDHDASRVLEYRPPAAAASVSGSLHRRVALLSDTVEALKWGEPASSLNVVDEAYSGLVDRWLAELLASELDARAPPEFALLLRELPLLLSSEERHQFIRIPRLRQLAVIDPHALAAFDLGLLVKLLYSFCVALGKFAPEGRGIWAPLGDAYLTPENWSAAGHIPLSPAIDRCSNFAIPLIPDLNSGYVPDPARMRASADNLQRALDFAETWVPESAVLLRKQAEVFVLRFGQGIAQHGLSSGSCHEWLGAIFLINADAGPQIVERVAEAAVHEAIHTLIYKIEEITVRLPQNGSAIVSPWSGNRIATANFIHACIVWYGLLHFWRRTVENGPGAETVVRFASRAERGFLARKVTREQRALRTVMDPLIVDLLIELEDDVAQTVSRGSARAFAR